MNRDEVLDTLRMHKQVLRERFDVTGLALYGFFARNQATPGERRRHPGPVRRPGYIEIVLRNTVLHRGPAWPPD